LKSGFAVSLYIAFVKAFLSQMVTIDVKLNPASLDIEPNFTPLLAHFLDFDDIGGTFNIALAI
jgi:hypothetical protein